MTLLAALVLVPAFAAAQQTSTFNGLTVTVSPASISINRASVVTVELRDASTGAAAANREVSLCGASLHAGFPSSPPSTIGSYRSSCPVYVNTSGAGLASQQVQPSSSSPIYVYIDGAYAYRSVSVTAGMLSFSVLPSNPTSSDGVSLAVYLPDGSGPSGSLVRVWRQGGSGYVVYDVGTDINGRVYLGTLAAGVYEVRANRAGYDEAVGTLTVVPPAAPNMQILSSSVPSTSMVGTQVRATLTLANQGTASGTATALLYINNAQRGSQSVTLAPGASQEVFFDFTPTVAGTYAVRMDVGTLSTGSWTLVVQSPRPTFQLRDLQLPATTAVGRAFDVGVVVANGASSEGWAELALVVDGAQVDSRSLYLTPGASQSASFTLTLSTQGYHEIVVRTSDSEVRGGVQAVRAEPSFVLRNLQVPTRATAGTPFTASVEVANEGSASGVASVNLFASGVVRASASRSVAPGSSATITFSPFSLSQPGSYSVWTEVGLASSATSILTVEPAPVVVTPTRTTPSPPPPAATPSIRLRGPDATPLAGAQVILLSAGPDGALVSRGAVVTDGRGEILVDPSKASHIAVPDTDGFAILPIPSSGRLVVPQGAVAASHAAADAPPPSLDPFQDARVFTVGARRANVTVGYAGVERVEVESTVSDARLVVARYGDKPSAGLAAPPGPAHRWFDLHLLRADGSDAPLVSATVRFARPDGAEGDLVLYHYVASTGAWETLDVVDNGDGTFQATVSSFSLFAIGTEAPTLFEAPWFVPTAAIVGLVALGGIAAVVVPRMSKRRRAPKVVEEVAPTAPVEEVAIVPPAPPPPPPLVRRAAPRRPLAGDVVLSHVGVRTGGKTFLEDVSFRVPRGTITALHGPTGSGKAMTLLAILGEAPTIGDVDVGGMRPGADAGDLRRSVGASAAGAQLDRDRTVEEIFDAVADRRQLPRIEARMRGERVLSLLGAGVSGASRVADLSTPEERRVLIAAALLHEPELLLLDEPTVDLPPAERRALWDGIRRVREDLGLTVLATTRYGDDAMLADGVVMLEGGRVVGVGAPTALARELSRS